MRHALRLLAVVAAAGAAKLPQPTGLYLPPTAEFDGASSLLSQVSQAPSQPVAVGGVSSDGLSEFGSSVSIPERVSGGQTVEVSYGQPAAAGGSSSFSQEVVRAPGCCGQSSGQPGPIQLDTASVTSQVVQAAGGPVSLQTSVHSQPELSSHSVSSQSGQSVSILSDQSAQSVSGQSVSVLPDQSGQSVSVQSGPAAVRRIPLSSGGHSQSSYYESGSDGTQFVGSRSPVVPATPARRPNNVFLDSPSRFESQQVTSQKVVRGPAPSRYTSNVFLNGQASPQFGGNGIIRGESGGSVTHISSSKTEYSQQGSGTGYASYGSVPVASSQQFVSSSGPAKQQLGSGPIASSHQFVSSSGPAKQQLGSGPGAPSHQFVSSSGPAKQQLGSGTITSSQQHSYGSGPAYQQHSSRPSVPRQPLGSGSSISSQQQQHSSRPSVPRQPLGSSSSLSSQQQFLPQQQQLVPQPAGQLLNRHPGGGGSGPLGHQLTTCSTSLVCVPIAMCNPYTGFVRGGLLFEPEEPTLQPTVALDRCTRLKDGGTGDGVCCQMPHINDPWPRDQ